MSDHTIAAERGTVPVARSVSRDRFFVGMAWLLLAVNVVGFAPTYFLKPLVESPVLPLRTHLHGVLFTSWFVLFAVQTTLVARGDVRLHRKLGVAGAVLAGLMVVSALTILYFRALEYSGTPGSMSSTATVVWANLVLLALFTGFAATGIAMRRTPGVHKRLMLLASLSMMPQSLGRIGRAPVFQLSESPLLGEIAVAIGGLAALLGAMIVHDLATERRLHRVTLMGVPLLFVSIILSALVVPGTSFAQGLILWLN